MLPRLAFALPFQFLCALLFLLQPGCDASGASEGSETSESPGKPEEWAFDSGSISDDTLLSETGEEPDGVTGEPECIADCEGKACGPDGCGGLCGICVSDYQCNEDQQCVPVCTPQNSLACVGNVIHWMNSCGEIQLPKEECGQFEACIGGECVPCEPKDLVECDGGTRIRKDNCGNIVDELEICGEEATCLDGKCIAAENPVSGFFSVTLSPETSSVGTLPWQTTYSGGKVELFVDGAGQSALHWLGGEAADLPDLVGFLSPNGSIQMGGSLVEEKEGKAWTVTVQVQALFTDNDTLLGTLKEWWNAEGEPPVTGPIRDWTALRMPPRN